MAEVPATDGADSVMAKRDTGANIKSLIRTFEHSNSSDKAPTAIAEEEPSKRASRLSVALEAPPKDVQTGPNSSVQKIVQSFASLVEKNEDTNTRRSEQMTRQKSFTFGTKNTIIRRPPPPIPAGAKTGSSPSVPAQSRSSDHATQASSAPTLEPRNVSPTKAPAQRSPVTRSTSVVRAPLFGAAARAFSPTPGAAKRMTTALAPEDIHDEFEAMRNSPSSDSLTSPRRYATILSKRPPPAPPAQTPTKAEAPTEKQATPEVPEAVAAAAVQPETVEEKAPETPAEPIEAKPEPEKVESVKPAEKVPEPEVQPTAQAEPTPAPEATAATQTAAVAVVAEKTTPDVAVVVAEQPAPSNDEPEQAARAVDAAPVVTPVDLSSIEDPISPGKDQPATARRLISRPSNESIILSPKRTTTHALISMIVPKKQTTEAPAPEEVQQAPANEPTVAAPTTAEPVEVSEESSEAKDKKKRPKKDKTDKKKGKKDKDKSKSKEEEPSPAPTAADVEDLKKPKRSKSSKMSKMIASPSTERTAASAPSTPSELESGKKPKRSKQGDSSEEVKIENVLAVRKRAKSQRLSIDPSAVDSAAAAPEEAAISPRRSKKTKKTDSSEPSLPSSAEAPTEPTKTDSDQPPTPVSPSSEISTSSEGKSRHQRHASSGSKKSRLEPLAEEQNAAAKTAGSAALVAPNSPSESSATPDAKKKKSSGRLSVMLKLPDDQVKAPIDAPSDTSPTTKKSHANRRKVIRSLTSPLSEGHVERFHGNRADDSDRLDSDDEIELQRPLSARGAKRSKSSASSQNKIDGSEGTDSEVEAIKERLASPPRKNHHQASEKASRAVFDVTSSSSESSEDSDLDLPPPTSVDEPPKRVTILSHAHVVDDTDLTTDFEPDGRIHVVIKRRRPPPAAPGTIGVPNRTKEGTDSESIQTVVPSPAVMPDSDDELEIDALGSPSIESQRKKKRRGSAKPVPLQQNPRASMQIGDVNIWLEPATSNRNVLFEEQGKMFAYNQGKEMARKGGQGLAIKAASFNKLVEHLTWPDYNEDDKIYQKIFLAVLDYFSSPTQLMKKLAQRFDVPEPKKGVDSASYEATVKAPIQLRVCSVLKYWLEHFASEMSDALVEEIKSFVKNHLDEKTHKPVIDILTKALTDLVEKEKDVQERLRPPQPNDKRSASKRDLMRKTQSESTLIFFKTQKVCHPIELWANDEVARQITAVDWKLWSAIKPWEILKAVLNDPKYTANHSPLKELVSRFNQISNFVISAILDQKTVKERARLVSKFIKIGKELRQLNNFNSLMAISAGINHTCIARLSQTMAAVPRKDLKTLSRLDRLMSVKKNWKRYREALAEVEEPCIPYLGLIVADFVFVHEGHPNELTGLINFSKMKLLYFNCVEVIQTLQSRPYTFTTENLQVDRMIYTQQILEPNQIYKRSITLEPVKKGSEVVAGPREPFSPSANKPIRASSKDMGSGSSSANAPASPAVSKD